MVADGTNSHNNGLVEAQGFVGDMEVCSVSGDPGDCGVRNRRPEEHAAFVRVQTVRGLSA